MTILRSEELTVSSGTGVLDVRGGTFDAALIVAARFAAYQWHDCAGSVAQHLVRAASTSPVEAIESFRHAVTSPVRKSVLLSVHFSEVVSLLVNGRYRIELEDIPVDAHVVEFKTPRGTPVQDVTWFYPYDPVSLVSTQPASSISAEIVK